MYLEIYKELKKEEDQDRVEKNKIYHKYEGHSSFGVDTVTRNKILKKYKKEIKEVNCKDLLLNAEALYSYGIEETILAANFILKNRIDCINLSFLDKYLDNFCSWSTIDDFCINVLQPVLKRSPQKTISLLSKWNVSENMWKRRSSVVVFTRSVGQSGEFTDEALKFCENLIWDKEDMVQKGVGWCLKDIMRGEKEKVLDYVKKLRKRGVTSTITLYALREIRGEEKRRVLSN